MNGTHERKINRVLTVVFSLLCLAYVAPIFLVFLNSLKKNIFISREPFRWLTELNFNGLDNYIYATQKIKFFSSIGNSVIITVLSVILILVCCSMCAWYISRVRDRLSNVMYYLCIFSMVVPFQMVMFSLSKTADSLKLNTPWLIPVIYLGFGAGLAVFMFCGFVKSIPLEIEEAAMIDGCNPLQTFFHVVLPIMKPTYISVAILETMWIWNDYLLPYLVLDLKRYKTIPIVIQYLRGGYGKTDMGGIMACMVLAIIPIILFYLICQKHIIKGVIAGAVKG